jgi:hypothetical protein
MPKMGHGIHNPSIKRGVLFILLCIASITYAAKPVHEGKVIGVSDGDTLTLLTPEKQQIKVHLAAGSRRSSHPSPSCPSSLSSTEDVKTCIKSSNTGRFGSALKIDEVCA